MEIIWKLKNAYIRDVIEEMPEPKPHYNTIATLIKILVKKEVLKSEKVGNIHQYSPVAEFEDYREEHLVNFKNKYFGNSFPKMITYFAKKENLSDENVKELLKIIKSNKS